MTTEDRPMADITGGFVKNQPFSVPLEDFTDEQPARWPTAEEALRNLTTCRCASAWTDRKLHQTDCLEEYRDDVDRSVAEAEERGRQRGRAEAIADLRARHEESDGLLLGYASAAAYLEAKGHQP